MERKRALPVKPGQEYEVSLETLGVNGEGVGRIAGLTLFVSGGLPAERVRVKIAALKKNYALGELTEILAASPDRTIPPCPLYGRCGGCQLQHLSYEGQLKAKESQVGEALRRIGGLKQITVRPILGAPQPWHYRNKMQLPVGGVKGRPIIGCYAKGSHDIVDTPSCLIQAQGNNEILRQVGKILVSLKLPPYDEDNHRGLLRHLMGRVNARGELMVVLVTSSPKLPKEKELVRLIRNHLPSTVSIQQNIQTYRNNVILGRDTRLLWGQPTLRDQLGPLAFHISPRSFFQVNTPQAEVLYGQALELASLTGRETVVDAYCGTGTISLFLAQKARRVYGLEVVKPAVMDAQKNARDNHLKNTEFMVGDAADLMPRLYAQGLRPDVVTMDPPRAGCSPEFLRAAARMRPERIVYVSCNPATLARDAAVLASLGYPGTEARPVDMFPQTTHVETVMLFVRK